MSTVQVNVGKFVRAETDTMFAAIMERSGGVGKWSHNREPAPLDEQTIIRMNRDTLYSTAIVDISEGATVTLPDADDRYTSEMVVNQDHFINRIYHDQGQHNLTIDEFGTPWVRLAARTLADSGDPDDVRTVNTLQDELGVVAVSNRPFVRPGYDESSYQGTRNAVLELARHGGSFGNASGRREAVDPIQHLLAIAAGWGGLPREEALYLTFEPTVPLGEYKLDIGDVPVDAFRSISLYDRDGYFEANSRNVNSVNGLAAAKNADGSTTVFFGSCDAEKPNSLRIMEGWNCLVRLYRPRPEILDGTGSFPELETA